VSDIPDATRRAVIAEIYRQADRLEWVGLTQQERSTLYSRWLDDPDIGEVLTRHMPRERARLWMKDVPMKEYARARDGVGKYADLATMRLPGPNGIARQAFGDGWVVTEGSVRQKPNRCVIRRGDEWRTMIWGPPANFRDLVWAGINAYVDNHPIPVIVVTTTQGRKLTTGEVARHQALGKQAGLEVRHATLRAARLITTEPPGQELDGAT
jgi:hypothetical protein